MRRWRNSHVKTSGEFYRNSSRFGLCGLHGSSPTGGKVAKVELDEVDFYVAKRALLWAEDSDSPD